MARTPKAERTLALVWAFDPRPFAATREQWRNLMTGTYGGTLDHIDDLGAVLGNAGHKLDRIQSIAADDTVHAEERLAQILAITGLV
jgi:hypothetical protein